jgi:competence protein CoiA
MKFALVNGQRQEAQPNLSGECNVCGRPMIARCGEVRVRHWAHKGGRLCDPWWENETEWHRAWKNQFPADWQEISHRAEDGELHIADVKTDRGWVIEFQHSYLKPEERRSRESFYPKLIWVVNGTRRQRDRPQLISAWNEGVPVGVNLPVRRIFSDDCVLLREWGGSNAPAFFDFGELDVLWWLFAKSTNGSAYVGPFPRAVFIASHCGGATEEAARAFDDFVNTFPKQLAELESLINKRPIQGFQQYSVPRIGRRRRF